MNEPIALGAHLVVSYSLYDHHGIYIGNGKVVHYSGLIGKSIPCIEEVTLEQFSDGKKIKIKKHKKKKYSDCEVVERAKSRIGEFAYSVTNNNCEHFVYWCIKGRNKSKQVENGYLSLSLALIPTTYKIPLILAGYVTLSIIRS